MIIFPQTHLTVEEAKSKASLNEGRLKCLGGRLGRVFLKLGLGWHVWSQLPLPSYE